MYTYLVIYFWAMNQTEFELYYQKWEPKNRERETTKILAIVHGFGDHR